MNYTICRKGLEGQIFDNTFSNMIAFEIDEEKCIFKTLNYISKEKLIEETKVEIAGTFDKFKAAGEIEDFMKENCKLDSEQLKAIDIIEIITDYLIKTQKITQVVITLDENKNFMQQVINFGHISAKNNVNLEIQQSTSLDERNCTFGTDSRGNDFVYYRENNIVIQKNELCSVVQTLGFAGYIQMKKTMEHFEEITENI